VYLVDAAMAADLATVAGAGFYQGAHRIKFLTERSLTLGHAA
jgi:hypothetical protein